MRKGIVGHEIPTPYLGRIEAELSGEEVDHPLDQKSRLRLARAPVCIRRRLVREDADHFSSDVRNRICTGRQQARESGDGCGLRLKVGPKVGENPEPQGGDRAVAPSRDLHVLDLVTGMTPTLEVFRPILDPFDRARVSAGEMDADELLTVGVQLLPE